MATTKALAQGDFSITQITESVGGGNGEPSIDGTGTRIAFRSNIDLVGSNPDLNDEIFLFDFENGSLTQITHSIGGTGGEFLISNSGPTISAGGTFIAFMSNRDLVPPKNTDLNQEIFLFDATMGTFVQITETIGGRNSLPSISADGSRIAFQSDRDLSGGNSDGNIEIFLFDTGTGEFIQVTHSIGGGNFEPAINGDGTRLAFASDRDYAGANPDGNLEIFGFETPTNTFTQISNTLEGFNTDPSISSNGQRVAFIAATPIGFDLAAFNIAFFDRDMDTLTQITADGVSRFPRISADGTRIAFESSFDLILFNIAENTFVEITTGGGPASGIPFASINANGNRIAFQSSRDLVAGNADFNSEIFVAIGGILIDFNDPTSLAPLCYLDADGNEHTGAFASFVLGRHFDHSSCPGSEIFNDAYVEDNVLFFNGVFPEDSPLGPAPLTPEYHLGFENCDGDFCSNFLELNENRVNEPRVLSPHNRGAVIQLTYDPNKDGVPDPFNLMSLDVLGGEVIVGGEFASSGDVEFSDILIGGSRYSFPGLTNVIRAILRQPSVQIFTVDNVVIEPFTTSPANALSLSLQRQTTLEASLQRQTTLEAIPTPLPEIPPIASYISAFLDFVHRSVFAPPPRIDIMPGSDTNPLNLRGKGLIPVAILTTEGFNALDVDPLTVKLGPGEATEFHQKGHIEDVDQDGRMDLILHFQLDQIGVQCGDSLLTLVGQTFDGEAIFGIDVVETLGCQ